MIFIDKMKNLKIYKTQLILPTLQNDKKKGSLILMLTPNYNASKRLMTSDLFVNKLRYSSYYIEKDLSYYINDKEIKAVEIDPDELQENFKYQAITEMTAEERNKLPDSAFGIPSKRKYPLDTEAHVRSAIRFFNYCDKEDEETLAKNIIKAMKKFDITDIKVSDKNRFYKYYKAMNEDYEYIVKTTRTCPICNQVKENMVQVNFNNSLVYVCQDCRKKTFPNPMIDNESYSTDKFLKEISDNVLNLGDKVMVFDEDTKYDTQLKRLLFKDRIRRRSDVLALYDKVMADMPFIKYTFADLGKYFKKNLFVDLYYYNNSFFQNNTWVLKKGLNLYYDFMQRLLNDSKFASNGYSYKTIFIPVEEWDRGGDFTIWDYRKNINPISVIYNLMFTSDGTKLKNLFGKTNIIFVAKDKYFKINFSEIELKELKQISTRFKSFITKICTNQAFDLDDMDITNDKTDSPEVARAKVVDAIDVNKGIDLTPQIAAIDKEKKDKKQDPDISKTQSQKPASIKYQNKIQDNIDKSEDNKNVDKASQNNIKSDIKRKSIDAKKMALAMKIDKAASNATSDDDIYDALEYEETEDDTESITKLLIDIQTSGDDSVDLTAGRAARMTELDQKLMESEVKGKTVKEILNEKEPEPIVTSLDIATPDENWKSLTFNNFDKNYDIDKDIIACFRHMSTCSRPLAIRNISVENTSTSEDRVETYKVEYEDYKGKRFTVKLDIPIMVDNRFLLRGNNKSIQTQLYNMPIIKTDTDVCQIISNYMKIFIYRVGETQGRVMPLVSKFLKAQAKYNGTAIKFITGNSEKICSRYNLPIDYINLSSFLSKIETSEFIIYFDQDKIRELYEIKEGIGVPYMYNKKTKEIVYLSDSETKPFINILIELFENNEKYSDFIELIDKAISPSRCAYTSCSIVNTDIPLAVICGFHEGMQKTLDKANIKYEIIEKLTPEMKADRSLDYIRFNDGYLVFPSTYESSLLLNGLKICDTDEFSVTEIDNKNMYLEFLDDFGGRIKADGLENFYDLMMDPITVETLEFYKLPTDYISVLLYANALLSDNKFIKHTDMCSRRLRRYELIAVYTYKSLSDAYTAYANKLRHSSAASEFYVKQSAVIDKFLADPISSDDSCINALRDIETTNAITTKGPSGMNSDRAYSLDKRTYDDSMANIIGMSTGFAGNVGVTRQATIDANIEGTRGYVKGIDGDTDKMNTTKTLTATEALTPFGSTRDDPFRTAMTFIQTSKHQVRTVDSDPLLITTGMDEAMPYLSSDQFAFKAKKDGKVKEINKNYMIIEYSDNTYDYIELSESIKKNSDGGYYVPLKLDPIEGLAKDTEVKAGQIVAFDKLSYSNSLGESDNIAYNIGKLAKIAVINSDDGFEDSGVVTERLSEKLATPIDLMSDIVIEKDSNVLSIVKVGDKISVGDPLIVWQEPFDDEESNTLLKTLAGTDVSELGKRKLESNVTGVVKDIKIYRTLEIEDMSESLQNIVSSYEEYYNKLESKFEKYNLDKSQIRAHTKLPAMGKLKRSQEAVLFEFYLEYQDTVGIGDKIVAYSANKMVIKSLIPKGSEPYTEFRPNEPIDAFASEVSIDKRMVTSTVIYGSIQKALVELDRSVKDIMGIPYDDSTV